MRIRSITVLLVLGLAMPTAAPATAQRDRKQRSVETTYLFSPVSERGFSGSIHDDSGLFFGRAWTIQTKPYERSLSVSVADDFADAVAAAVWQEKGPTHVFCGSAEDLKFKGGRPVFVQVFLEVPGSLQGCESTGVPTQGTISATLR